MACPLERPDYHPCIPSLLGFGNNLTQHETSLRPFLNSLPWGCRYIFEPAELRNRLSDQAYEIGKRSFRRYIEHATTVKDVGNAAYARNDPAEAITKYAQAIEELEKLLLKSISEEEERDRETRTLLAVCWANSSAAKMLEVPGYETNLEDARLHAEKAITSDPIYAKGYVESLEMCCIVTTMVMVRQIHTFMPCLRAFGQRFQGERCACSRSAPEAPREPLRSCRPSYSPANREERSPSEQR